MADFYIVPPRLIVGSFDRTNAVTSLNSLKGDLTLLADTNSGLRVSVAGGNFRFSVEPNFYVKITGSTVTGNLLFTPSGSNFGVAVGSGSANPGSGTTGGLFFNTTDGTLKVYDGTSWGDIISTGGITQANADLRYLKLDGTNTPTASLSMGSQFLRLANLATQASPGLSGQIFYNQDIEKISVYTPSGWMVVGTAITAYAGVGISVKLSSFGSTISVDESYNFTWTGAHVHTQPITFAASQSFDINKLDITGQAAGDLIYYDGSNWNRLPIGDPNQGLKVLPSGTGITWGTVSASGGGSGVSHLNNLTEGFQFFDVGTSGNLFNISSVGQTHTFNIPIAGVGKTGLVSPQAQTFEGIKTFNSNTIFAATTGSATTGSGSVVIYGGLGISENLNVGGSAVIVGDLTVHGTTTTVNSTIVTIDDKNIELAATNTPSDAYAEGGGITLKGTTDKFINWYAGVGWSSSESWNLGSGQTFKIGNTTVLSNSSLGTGVTNSSLTALGTITTGTWSATAITAFYGGTGLVPSFTVGDILYASTPSTWGRLTASSTAGDILVSAGSGATPTYVSSATITVGFATTASYSHQSGYAITSGFATTAGLATTATYAHQSGYATTSGFATTAGLATTATYAHQSGYALTSGFAITAANFNVTNVSSGIFYPVLSNTSSTASGIAASVNGLFSFNASNGGFAATSVNIFLGQSYSINGISVLSSTSLGTGVTNSSLTAVGTISTGVWAGSLITSFYGGTGYASYTTGDLLVGTGSSLAKVGIGNSGQILVADSSAVSGLRWISASGLAITSINGLTSGSQTFATGTSGTGFNISSLGSSHTFNIPIAGTGATGLVSTLAQSFAGVKTFTNDVIVSSSTASTSANTGALQVYGGLGVSGQLSFVTASMGFTGITSNPVMSFIGTTNAPITLTVLADNSLLYEGSSGKLFGINNNLSTGWIFNVGDISGLPIIRANADGTIAMAEFAANVGIGLSNPSYKLHVVGDTNLSSGYVYRINGTSVLSSTQVLGLTVSSGTITSGVWAGTLITNNYGGTGYASYTTGDLLVGTGATLSKVGIGNSGQVLVADSSTVSGVRWINASGIAITSINGLVAGSQTFATGTSGTGFNISSLGSSHTFNIPIAGTGATGLVTTLAQSFAGIKTFTNDVVISSNTGSTSSATGALVITGGVGIGGSLFTSSTFANSISGVVLNNGVITTGAWAGSVITAFYGGTGFASYTVGDILYANTANTLGKLVAGTAGSILVSSGAGATPTYTNPATLIVGSATTANNLNVTVGTLSANHPLLFTPSQSGGSGVAVSSSSPLSYNPSSAILSVSGLAITAATAATNFSSGALIVTGGVGIGGSLFVNGDLTINGTTTTINSVTLTVDDKNIELGSVSSPSDATAEGGGITLKGTSDKVIAWYSGIGWSSSEDWNLAATKVFKINNTTVLSNSSLGVGITNSSLTALGTITTGTWAGTLITAKYGGTGYDSYTKGDLIVGAGSTFIKLAVGTNGYVLSPDSTSPSGLGWTTVSGVAVTSSPPAGPKNADLWFNSEDGSLSVYYQDIDTSQWVEIAVGSGIDLSNDVHITSGTASTNTATGALIVDGGVGVGGALNASSVRVNGGYDLLYSSLVTSTSSANQVGFAISSANYRTLKFIVSVDSGANYQSDEILMMHDGSSVFMTEYAQILSGSGTTITTYDGDITSGNIRLLVSPLNSVTNYRISCTGLRV